MIGIQPWMLKPLIELIGLVELRMFGSIDWWRRGLLKRGLFRELNRNRMCNQQCMLEESSKEISSNPKKLWNYCSTKVRLMQMSQTNSWTRGQRKRKRHNQKRVNIFKYWKMVASRTERSHKSKFPQRMTMSLKSTWICWRKTSWMSRMLIDIKLWITN